MFPKGLFSIQLQYAIQEKAILYYSKSKLRLSIKTFIYMLLRI